VRAQVDARLAAERATEREILRFVSAAHVVGLSVPPNTIASVTGEPADLHESLLRLEHEFLLRRTQTGRWSGLHELRSTAVHERLHELPPPTEAETFARLVPTLADEERRQLIIAA